MSHIADRLEAARLESASAEAAALDELERKLKWIKPAGISARDLWAKLGRQGDVAGLLRRLEALREDGGRAVLVGELWYHGSVTLPHIRLPVAAPEGGNVATPPPPPPSSAKLQAATAAERREQILAVLASHDGIRCSDVARELSANVSTIHNDLMRMQVQGQARKDHNGMWRLVPPPTEPPSPEAVLEEVVRFVEGALLGSGRTYNEITRHIDAAFGVNCGPDGLHDTLARARKTGRVHTLGNRGVYYPGPAPEPPATPAETSSQIDPPAPRTPEPPPPPADPPASTVEITEGEVVATLEPEPQAGDERPDPLSLLDELVAAGRAIEAARREIAEHTADALIADAFEEIAAFVGAPDYTDPREVYRAVSERESELLSRIAAAREEASELREELERIRGVLRAALGEGP